MSDKTTLGISEPFRQYIEALVEEVVLEGKPFDDQKEWLRRYSEAEVLSYKVLERNLNEFFEAIKELEEYESDFIERSARALAKDCYLSEDLMNKLLGSAATIRAQKEVARGKEREITEHKARENPDISAEFVEMLEVGEETTMEKVKQEAEKKDVSNELDDHEYVDLGLPSGTLWASCNVGANKPEDYGDYFAWGETCPKKIYDEEAYKYFKGNDYTKYNEHDGLKVLQPNDDAVVANWGRNWRMPTKEEWEELTANTTTVRKTRNGVKGRLFMASNGSSIFLPAAGRRWDDKFNDSDNYGGYWSSSLFNGCHGRSYIFYFYFGMAAFFINHLGRTVGLTIRPVRSAR